MYLLTNYLATFLGRLSDDSKPRPLKIWAAPRYPPPAPSTVQHEHNECLCHSLHPPPTLPQRGCSTTIYTRCRHGLIADVNNQGLVTTSTTDSSSTTRNGRFYALFRSFRPVHHIGMITLVIHQIGIPQSPIRGGRPASFFVFSSDQQISPTNTFKPSAALEPSHWSGTLWLAKILASAGGVMR